MKKENKGGKIIWNIVFGLFYPVITLFSYILTAFLSIFSGISTFLADILNGKKPKD